MADTDIPRVKNPGFFDLLVSKNFLNEKDAGILKKKFETDALKALLFLARQNPAKKGPLSRAWADSISVAHVELEKTLFQPEVVGKIPEQIAKKYKILPVYKFGDTVTIATADPGNEALAKELETVVGSPISMVFSLPEDIEKAIGEAYASDDSLEDFIGKIASASLFQKEEKITPEALLKLAGNQAVFQLPVCIILFAVKENATDIHIEPGLETIRVRFRIDGVLTERMILDLSLLSGLVSRLVSMAGLNDEKKDIPKEGRLNFPLPGQRVDFFLSIVPTIFGDKIVLKRQGGTRLTEVPRLNQLFLSKRNHDRLTHILRQPYGLFLVTGPMGSGKSTLLYSALGHVNTPDINITTIEDTVKYRLDGINQVRADASNNFRFPEAIESCLSQDVQILMAGEILHKETAGALVNAALADHLVMAGMHASDVFHAIIRFLEMGVKASVAASLLTGVYSQRLVRRLCDQCKEKFSPSREQLDALFETDGTEEIFFYAGKGCATCHQTGFLGRIALQEVLLLDDHLRKYIADNGAIMELRRDVMENGFQDMRYDGFKKVLRGLTTIDEVNRVTVSEF